MKSPLLSAFALLGCAVPVFALVTVSSPAANSTIGSPFVLSATAGACSSQPISAMGYSMDTGPTTIVNAAAIYVQVASATGAHTLHVKSWGNHGASCTTDVPVTVSSFAAPGLFTDVSVAQPAAGAKLVSPFAVAASGTQCNSQAIAAFGYSIDDSSATTVVYGTAVNAQVSSATGAHVLHVKSWGKQGSACVSNVAIDVVPSPAATVPASALAVNAIQTLTNWRADVDTAAGDGSSASGVTSLVNSPSLSGTARQFATSFANYSGVRYNASFGADTSATSFLYDGWFYLGGGSGSIGNLEFDLNQVIPNGDTVIFGFQCDSWSKTWDYTANQGTPQQPVDAWLHSSAPCNVQNWAINTWHHVQIAYSRDTAGNATYQSVWLDNVEQDLNVTVPSAFALGWSPVLLTNFQVDGMTVAPGSATVTMDELTIYRW